jgi:hypothetical protein
MENEIADISCKFSQILSQPPWNFGLNGRSVLANIGNNEPGPDAAFMMAAVVASSSASGMTIM